METQTEAGGKVGEMWSHGVISGAEQHISIHPQEQRRCYLTERANLGG